MMSEVMIQTTTMKCLEFHQSHRSHYITHFNCIRICTIGRELEDFLFI